MQDFGTFTQKDYINLPIQLVQDSSFSWSGVVVASSLKQSTNGTGNAIFNFNPVLNYTSSGILYINLTGAANETANFPIGKLYGDVVVEISGSFGPYTVAPYYITMAKRITTY